MGQTAYIDKNLDPEAPITQGMALLILRKLESIEAHFRDERAGKHPAFVNVAEFSLITGAKRSTVITWLNTGKLKGSKIGRQGHTSPWRIPYQEVTRYIEEGI
jgi:hypothetical protein